MILKIIKKSINFKVKKNTFKNTHATQYQKHILTNKYIYFDNGRNTIINWWNYIIIFLIIMQMIPLAEPKKEVTRYKISSVERLGKISKKKKHFKV